jgi:hypothetical protein
VIAVAHPDVCVARELVRATVGIFAHFARGSLDRLDPSDRAVVQEVTRAYDTERHAQSASRQTSVVPGDFVDRFAIVGGGTQAVRYEGTSGPSRRAHFTLK